jgi:hypothetical protein
MLLRKTMQETIGCDILGKNYWNWITGPGKTSQNFAVYEAHIKLFTKFQAYQITVSLDFYLSALADEKGILTILKRFFNSYAEGFITC